MKIFICNNCTKSFCWEGKYSDMQCPKCRSQDLITDECVIASLINYLFINADKNFKNFLGDKND